MDGTNLEGVEVDTSEDVWSSNARVAQELKSKHQPVEYSQMVGDARVLFLAENHSNHAIRSHIVSHAADLRRAGITHYAIEANEASNQALERLNAGEDVDLSKVDLGPGREDYEKAVRAMAAEGIKVVAVDIDQSTKPMGEEREARITENINRLLEAEPNSKIAVLIGGYHTSRHYVSEGVASVGRRLMEAQIPAVNVHFAGGEDKTPRVLTDGAREAGLAGTEFAFDLRPYASSLSKHVPYGPGEADYIVHLPQQGLRPVDSPHLEGYSQVRHLVSRFQPEQPLDELHFSPPSTYRRRSSLTPGKTKA